MKILLLAPVALKGVLPGLIDAYTRATGNAVAAEIVLNPEVPARIAEGADFDVAITNPGYVRDLVASGHADGASHAAFGRVPLALAVAGGSGPCATAPGDIATLLLRSDSIAYTGPGTSGRIFREMAEHLGVLDRIADRLRPMGAGEPIRAVAEGTCVLAAAPLTVVRATQGVHAAAICPGGMGTDIDMSVFLSRCAVDRPEARAFLAFLTDPSRDNALARAGVERFTLPAQDQGLPPAPQ